jgi:CDP-glycerol glycerophosphotransferase (TagB/SpsB family)
LWGQYKADFFGVPRIHLLVTGNPRIDQFARPLTDDQVEALGIPAGRPLALWLPTYRSAHGPAGQRWDDSGFLSASPDIREQWSTALEEVNRLGLTVVVKPHPLDSDSFTETGLNVVTDKDLRRDGA